MAMRRRQLDGAGCTNVCGLGMLEPYAGKLARTVLRGGCAGNGVALPAHTTVFLTNNKQEVMEVLTGPERRRRWSAGEKLTMVRESFEPGKSVSMVARQHGVNPNQLFHWRKLYQDGSLSAVSSGEEVVPASELNDALKQIRELQRLLGKKTMENEILREAVEVAKSRKWIARSPSLPGDDQ
ncbi:transposase [Paraburkholderia atlantica]